MKSNYFWNQWSFSYRLAYWLLLGVFLVSMGASVVLYYVGPDWFFGWQTSTQLEGLKLKVADVHLGAFQIPIETPLYLVETRYEAAPLQPPHWAFWAFGGGILLVFTLLLAIFTELKSWIYGLAMGLVALFLATLGLDYLGLWPAMPNGVLMVGLLGYLALSFLFQSFWTQVAFGLRWLAFVCLTFVFGLVIAYRTELAAPVAFLSNFGMLVPIGLTLLFIFMTAHEVIRGIWYGLVRYNPEGGRNNLTHFSILSLIYLGNLGLILAERRQFWNSGFYTIDVIWWLVLAALVGIGGFRQRNRSTYLRFAFPFAPVGAFVYLGLGTVAFLTMSFHFASANDAFVEMLTDVVLYSYLGFGFAFMAYLLSNFAPVMAEPSPLDEIVYEGKLVPYYMVYYFGIGVFVALLAGNRQLPLFQGRAAFYIAQADAWYWQGERRLAQDLYKIARDKNDYLSHRANYMLSLLAPGTVEEMYEVSYLRIALERSPTAHSFGKMAAYQVAQERYFDALFTLKEGVRRFPDHYALSNNLAFLYKKNKISDSTIYFFEKAGTQEAQNNLWAFYAEKLASSPLDSIPIPSPESQNRAGLANQIALFTAQGKAMPPSAAPDSGAIPRADDVHFAWLYNYGLNQRFGFNARYIAAIEDFMQRDSVRTYGYNPHFLRALSFYYGGQVQRGVQALAAMPSMERDPYPNTVAGLWLAEQGAYGTALEYLRKAQELGNQKALFYEAIVRSEMHDFEKALPLWQALLRQSPDKSEKALWASRMLRILSDSIRLDDDLDKYNFVHYKLGQVPESLTRSVYESIENTGLRTQAAADMMLFYLRQNDPGRATLIYEGLPASAETQAYQRSSINFAYGQLLLATQQYKQLLDELPKLAFVRKHENYRPYFEARARAGQGETKGLVQYFEKARQSTPFDTDIILGLAEYYEKNTRNTEKAYLTVAEGVRTNPFAVVLQKKFALLALGMGLDYYAEDARQQIEKLASAEEYKQFMAEYTPRLEAFRARLRGNAPPLRE
ncbi:MAG: hypothetical protein OHK0053_06390 [Microscillaceae bacterium]